MPDSKYRSHQLQWPFDRDQLDGLNLEIDKIYRIFAALKTISSFQNDVNVTGNVVGSVGVLGWQGALALARGGLGFNASAIAKGDLILGSGLGVAGLLHVGGTGTVLTADPTQPFGAKWGVGPGQAVVNEIPAGAINGSNTVFTTANNYATGSLMVYLNGQRLTKTTDYSETTVNTFTFVNAPLTGDTVVVDYNRSLAGPAGFTPGLVKIATANATNSLSLNFFSRNVPGFSGNLFQSDYSEYLIELLGLVPQTNNIGMGLRVTTNGSTWDSSALYDWTHWVYGPAGTGNTFNTAQTEMRTIGFVNASNTTTFGINGYVRVFDPLSAVLWKAMEGKIAFWDTGPGLVTDMFSGAYRSTTAILGIQAIPTTGNIVSGTINVFAIG